MELNEFRNNTKVTISEGVDTSNEIITSIVEGFVNSNMPFYNTQTSLMSCLDLDKSCEGKIDVRGYDSFMNKLMLNMCFDMCHGKENYLKLSEPVRVKFARTINMKNKDTIMTHSSVCYNTSGICPYSESLAMEHEFIIKVLPADFVSSLNYLYDELRSQNLKDFRIVTPSTRFVCSGYNAPLKLKCKTKDLDKMINFLNGLDKKFIEKTKPVLPVYNITGSWYGYQQQVDGKTAPANLSSAIYDAIYATVVGYIEAAKPVMDDGVDAATYFNESKNKFVALRQILGKALSENREKVLEQIVEVTKARMYDRNVNMADFLRFSNVNNEVEKIFGKELDVEQLFNERVEEVREIKTPVTVVSGVKEKPLEEQRLEKVLEDSNAALEQAMEDKKNGVKKPSVLTELKPTYTRNEERDARKRELEAILANASTFPSNYRSEEEMNAALGILGVNEFVKGNSEVVNKDYMTHLNEDFLKYAKTNEAGKEQIAAYNDALQEYKTILYEEALESSPDMNLPEGYTPSGSQDSEELDNISSGIDIAIEAIIAMEEREREEQEYLAEHPELTEAPKDKKDLSSLDLIDISRNSKNTFAVNNVAEIPVETSSKSDENSVAETPESSFAEGKTEVLTDVVTEVAKEIKEEKAIQSNDIDLEKLHNPDNLQRINPESNCLEYLLANDLLIPDLADIAYKGDSLIDALHSGGYQTDFDYIRDVAKHFGLEYSGSKEDNKQLLDVLKNLDKYYFDGSLKEEKHSGAGYIGSKEDNIKLLEALKSVDKSKFDEALEKEEQTITVSESGQANASALESSQEVEEMFAGQSQVELPIQRETLLRDSYKYRYSNYVSDTAVLDLPVKGTDYTVLDYFLFYDLSNAYYKPDSRIILHAESREITGKEFTEAILIDYLTSYGAEEMDRLLSFYVADILPPNKNVSRKS